MSHRLTNRLDITAAVCEKSTRKLVQLQCLYRKKQLLKKRREKPLLVKSENLRKVIEVRSARKKSEKREVKEISGAKDENVKKKRGKTKTGNRRSNKPL